MAKNNLKESLQELEKIISWFEEQEEIDVEAGLEKVKEGVKLIKGSKARLRSLENEFEEVKNDLEEEVQNNGEN